MTHRFPKQQEDGADDDDDGEDPSIELDLIGLTHQFLSPPPPIDWFGEKMNKLHTLWTYERTIRAVSTNPGAISILKSSVFELMQTVIMDRHPEEEWEEHPTLVNTVANFRFTHNGHGENWIFPPGFQAFLHTNKDTLCITINSVYPVVNSGRKNYCNPANFTIAEPTHQTFEGIPPAVEPPKSTASTDADIKWRELSKVE